MFARHLANNETLILDLQSSEAKWLEPSGIPHKTRSMSIENEATSEGRTGEKQAFLLTHTCSFSPHTLALLYCCLHRYHYGCNAPSTCLCIFKLSLPRQRSFCLLQGGNFSGSTKVILSWTKAGSSMDSESSTSYICRLSFPCCSAEPEGERSPAGKGQSERHALNKMLRAMTTELVSKWQPHWQSILLIPYTVLTYETFKSLDTYWFLTSLLKRKGHQKNPQTFKVPSQPISVKPAIRFHFSEHIHYLNWRWVSGGKKKNTTSLLIYQKTFH